jgi:hypothetical protein
VGLLVGPLVARAGVGGPAGFCGGLADRGQVAGQVLFARVLAGVDAALDRGGLVAVGVAVVLAASGSVGHAAEGACPLLLGGCGGGQVGGAVPGEPGSLELGDPAGQRFGVAGIDAGEQGSCGVGDAGGLPGLLALLLVASGGLAVLERALDLAVGSAQGGADLAEGVSLALVQVLVIELVGELAVELIEV